VDDDALLDEARRLAGRAASGPPELVATIKASLRDMAGVATHDEAVARELDPQVVSLNQPAFAERLAALQARISTK
jgi:enoyl-CoA hydratase